MKRDATGKFVSNWNCETKQRVSVSLTNTAWRSLDQEAQRLGISRSEVIERFARTLEGEQSLDADKNGADAQINSLQEQILENQQVIAALQCQKQELEALLEKRSRCDRCPRN
jgi:metal-responsive CopG/Arc/MetJ family transcriptional regulator